MSFLKRVLPKKQDELIFTAPSFYPQANRFSFVGTVGCGKSTIAGLIVLTTQTLCTDMPTFFCRVLEKQSTIYQDVSDLRDGHFPAKTTAMNAYTNESGLLMEWDKLFGGFKVGTQKLQLPITDIAGEDLQMMDTRYVKNIGPLGNALFSQEQRTLDYIKDSDGFLVVLAADRARGLVKRGSQVNSEMDKALSRDPDVNLVRILNAIIDYRERKRKPIKGLGIILHKLDAIRPYVDRIGLDLFNETSQQDLFKFVDVFFPSLSQTVKSTKLANVHYFPSYVELEYNEDGSVKTWVDHSPVIQAKDSALLDDRRKPSYPERTYVNIIEWLHGFAL